MKFQKPRGTKDILPKDIDKWKYTENIIRKIMVFYNFKEIRTPTFENTSLFTRGVGEGTDIVSKEMYTFDDKSGNSLTLKPEMTASVIRAYIENSLGAESPVQKLYYITNMFRYEKPQEGRFREHTQFGAEIIGSSSIYSDAELISLARDIYSEIGIKNIKVKINSIGNSEERTKYVQNLKEYLSNQAAKLSEDSKRRLETNPLRILDSKDKNDKEVLQKAPLIYEFLPQESKERFEKVLSILKEHKINYEIDYKLVRGLDYYNDTTFEFISESLGAQDALAGGGRYDGLVEELGGKPTPGCGFGSGIERLIMVAEKNNFQFPQLTKLDCFIVTLTAEAVHKGFNIAGALRNRGYSTEVNYFPERSMKSQLREANRSNAVYVIIIGEDELRENRVKVKNMQSSTQNEIALDKTSEEFSDIYIKNNI